MAPRQDLLENSRRLRTKRRQNVLWQWLIIFVLLFVATVAVFHLPQWAIKTITVSGNKTLAEADLVKIADPLLAGSYFYLIPKRNIVFYPKGEIEMAIAKQFPRLSAVSIFTDNPTSISINVVERKPSYLWCAPDCWFMDDSGVVFELATIFPDHTFLEFHAPATTTVAGTKPLVASDFALIKTMAVAVPAILKARPGSQPSTVTRAMITDSGDFELMIQPAKSTATSSAWKIIFNNQSTSGTLMSNLVSVFSSEKLTTPKGGLPNIDYIDLRFGKKVFYKLKS